MFVKSSLERFLLLIILFSSAFYSCKENTSNTEYLYSNFSPTHAEGFEIFKIDDSNHVLTIKKPWKGAQKTFRYLVSYDSICTLEGREKFDAVISAPVNTIVVSSTTHLPSIESLGMENALVGYPGLRLISSKKFRTRIAKEKIAEVGVNGHLNIERLLILQPEVIVGFGVDRANKNYETLEKSGLNVIYNGDWLEHSPLGKAEWIRFFGLLFDKQREADSVFREIESNYQKGVALALRAKTKPSVLSGAMYRGVWYLPGGKSTEAQLMKDANVNYLWESSNESGSLSLSFEAVLERAKNADIWLNPSIYTRYEDLEKAHTNYRFFKPFTSKKIYTVGRTRGDTGGVLYYEKGVLNPDKTLLDLINICHPELRQTTDLHFYKPLEDFE